MKRNGTRWATSIAQAAALTEFSPAALKVAKRKGCTAFRNGRVCIPELTAWMKEHEEEFQDTGDKDALECRRLLAQCEKLEFQLAAERGDFLAKSEVVADMVRIGHGVVAGMQRFVADSPTWEGLPAADIEKRASSLKDQVCADLHDATSKLYA